MDFATDVLICGAGVADLTLAIDLARRGISFRLIEKQPNPFHGSRGKGIQPRSQEIFEDLGLLDWRNSTVGSISTVNCAAFRKMIQVSRRILAAHRARSANISAI